MEDRALMASPATLPSKGLLYDGAIPGGRVLVAPIAGAEERMIATAGAGVSDTVVDTLIGRCVFDEKGDSIKLAPQEYLLGDRIFLMQVIRCVTHGSGFSFEVDCPSCRKPFVTQLNLPDDLETYWLDDNATEPFAFSAPFSKINFSLRLLRGRDATAVSEYAAKHKRAMAQNPQLGDPAYFYRLVRSIVSVDFMKDEAPIAQMMGGRELFNDGSAEVEGKLNRLLEMMHGRDTNALRNAIDDVDPGLQNIVMFKCPVCTLEFKSGIPYDANFFRPSSGPGTSRRR